MLTMGLLRVNYKIRCEPITQIILQMKYCNCLIQTLNSEIRNNNKHFLHHHAAIDSYHLPCDVI